MTSIFNLFVVAVTLAVSSTNVHCKLSDEDRSKIQVAVLPLIAECGKDYGVTVDEIKAAKASGKLGEIDHCLMACVFKKMKLINDDGLFDGDVAEELVKKYVSNEDNQKKLIGIIEDCKSVNDKDVSDGKAGCERSKLLFECSIPFKGEFIESRR